MNALILALRVLAIAFIAVAALHLSIGMHADAMLGADVPPTLASDPSLDSQNRFYGITFSLLGVALLVSTTDLRRYGPIVVSVFGVLFVAGLGRAVSWLVYGAPSPPIAAIALADVTLPPLFIGWLKRALRQAP